MKPKLIVALALVAGLGLPGSAAQAEVLRVVVVKSQDTPGYVKEIERGRGLFKKLGTDPELRAWLAGLDKFRTIVSDSIYNELK